MTPLLKAELLKLRTTRTFAALAGSAFALSLLVVVLTAALANNMDKSDVREMFYGDFTGLFIVLLGVMGMAGEWRHRTITSTILAAPDRTRLLGAKLIAYAVAGVVISLVITVVIMAVGTAILSSRDVPTLGIADLADVLWRNLAVAGFLGAFGVCVGGLVRNQVVAIVGVLVLIFVVERVLLGLVSEVGQYAPTVGAPNDLQGNSFGADDALRPGVALLVMGAWIAALAAAAAALLRRRDLV
ncbi:MAG TPA: ABC transporter permease [Solirubrobacteraceae bacterium]|nr:ABC transporter permease [Solirubrobacteraceae bacterium]